MATLFFKPVTRFYTSTGEILAGGKLYFYTTGTTTLKDVYSTSVGDVALANPVVLDSNGEYTGGIWGSGIYKLVCKDSDDVEVYTIDPYTFADGSSTGSIGIPTGAATLVDNRMVKADGTSAIQVTGWSMDDSDNLTAAGNIVMADNVISGVEVKDMGETAQNLGNLTGNVTAIDYTAGPFAYGTLTGNATITSISNLPATGIAGSMTLEITQSTAGSHTLTWPAAYKWPGGSAPTLTATASAVDVFVCYSRDGGTTVRCFVSGQNVS